MIQRVAVLLVLACSSIGPVQATFCWGNLVVRSQSEYLNRHCPVPSLKKVWRISCVDGCGYIADSFVETLEGYGECFKGAKCRKGIVCLPLSGVDVRGYNPPSLSSSIVNRGGLYLAPPCGHPVCESVGVNTMTTFCGCDGGFDIASCGQNDPLIVSLGDQNFELTDRAGGVEFDLSGTGRVERVPWTHQTGREAFVALDRNGNGLIDSGRELFGDVTAQHASRSPNGFRALAVFDDELSGGDGDGRISADDEIFERLMLWQDSNHNGVSETDELEGLQESGLLWIDLEPQVTSRIDRFGNQFRYVAAAGWEDGSDRPVWNVFLLAN